jgi:Leucine-rich repeat (LRR) protein
MRSLIVFLSVLLTLSCFAQDLSRSEVTDFTKDGQELISYLEFTLNAIGDNELSPKEKDIIISESFLKMFRDENVQIEDDLDVSREAVTNKDVQAYFKDVDFFFRYANFTFNVLSIDLQIDENGSPFLLCNVLRTLKAIDFNGDTIENDQQRFIEIELNSDKRDLKIASIYTTKLNENEENIRWWNLLPKAWRAILGSNTFVSDSLAFSSIMILDENYIILYPMETNKASLKNDTKSFLFDDDETFAYNLAFNYDTIWLNDSSKFELKESLFKTLNRIMEIVDLNISGNSEITDLKPLSRLNNLRTLDVSFTHIQDIFPVRNLTNLHNLNCSNTFINSVDALIYSMELTILNISNTNIYSIESLANLGNLKILDISNTVIDNLEAISGMPFLEDLKMRKTRITDFAPLNALSSLNYLDLSDNQQLKSLEALSHLKQLKVIYFNNTKVKDLSPLSTLSNLETIYCENSEIESLLGLELLPNLKKIYCDNSLLGRQKAIDFMKEHPHILVVYESKQLQMWWNELPEAWKSVFSEIAEPDAIPTKEQLHEITTIKEINVAGNAWITSLIPLDKLKNLQRLNVAETSINDLDGISEAREMRILDISNTAVQRLYAIENLNLIEELLISYCPVKDLNPLRGMINLKSLNIDNTLVDNLSSLEELQNLRNIFADNTNIDQQVFEDFIELKKDILLVYKSAKLIIWWENLSSSWKTVFQNHMRWTARPKTEDLHKLLQIQSLEITENRAITELNPVDKLSHLRKLKVNDTKITDVSPLRNLKYLKEVDLSRNPITDLTSLQFLTNLEFLYLNNMPIDNLDWLFSLSQIKILDISGTEIKKLKGLNNFKQLEQLIAYNTKINKIKPLENLPNLNLLKIYNTRVSSRRVQRFKQKNPNCEIDYY